EAARGGGAAPRRDGRRGTVVASALPAARAAGELFLALQYRFAPENALGAVWRDTSMHEDVSIGRHKTYVEEPDILYLKLDGPCSAEEGREINRRHVEFGQGRERLFFLVDLYGLESI